MKIIERKSDVVEDEFWGTPLPRYTLVIAGVADWDEVSPLIVRAEIRRLGLTDFYGLECETLDHHLHIHIYDMRPARAADDARLHAAKQAEANPDQLTLGF